MTSSREAWERVLAAVEADARRAEALLNAPVESFAHERQEGGDEEHRDTGANGHDAALPVDWMLPTGTDLPPLEAMPPIPEELSDRILELRSQIMALQTELTAALRDIPRIQNRKLAAVSTVEAPAYIDRRL